MDEYNGATNDPFSVDYDPFAVGQYPRRPTPSSEPTVSGVAPSVLPAAAPQGLTSYEDYVSSRGNDSVTKIYDEYADVVLPGYMKGLGYTDQEVSLGVAEFKKQVVRPRVPDAKLPTRTNTEALVTDPLTALASGGNSLLKAANWFLEIVSPESWDKAKRQWLQENQESIEAFGSDNLKARKQRQEDANKGGALEAIDNAISDPVIIADMLIQSMVSMGVPVGTSAKAGQVVLDKALKAGLSREAAEQAAATAAARWALYSEGAVAAGTVGATVKSALDGTSLTDEEKLAWEATALPAGVVTALLGKFSPVEASLFTSKLASQGVPQKLIPAILTNASKESVEEYLQSGNEALWSNVGSRQVSPTNPQAWDGVAADAALGGLMGFVTGGALGAASKRKILKPVQQAQVDEVLDSEGNPQGPLPPGDKAVFDNEAADTGEVAEGQARLRQEVVDGLSKDEQPQTADEADVPTTPSGNATGSTPPELLPTIPEEIKRGNPTAKVNGQSKSFVFANDVDKALFIVAEGKRLSPIDQDLVTWLSKDVFPSANEDDIRAMGTAVKLAAQDLVTPGGRYTITVPGIATKQSIIDTNAAFVSRDAVVVPAEQASVVSIPQGKRKVFKAPQTALVPTIVPVATPQNGINPAKVAVPKALIRAPKRKVFKRAPIPEGTPTTDPNPTGFTVPPNNDMVKITEQDAQRLFDTLAGIPGDEIEAIAKHIYDAIDSGYGEPIVDKEKYVKAKALARSAKQAYSLSSKPSAEALDELEMLFTRSDSTPYTTQQAQAALEDQPLSQSVQKNLRNNNVQAALWGLYLTGSTPVVKATARKLYDLGLDSVTVRVSPNKGKLGKAVAGQFDNARKLLTLDPALGLNEIVFLHEAVHAATLQTINRPVTSDQRKAVASLSDIYAAAKGIIGEDQYAFTDLDEFVAESLSNPEFQALLYQLRPEQTTNSLWDRFVNAVRRLLGLDTMFDRIQQVAEALMVSPDGMEVIDRRVNRVASAPAPVQVKPSNETYTYLLSQNHPIQNFAKQLERQLLAQGASIPDVANLRLQNTLKRSQAEAAINAWTTAHWDGIAANVRNMQTKHGKDLEQVEKFLEQLENLGRAPQKLREYDPTMRDYAKERARLLKVEADANAYLIGVRQANPDFFTDMIGVANAVNRATKAILASRLAAKNNMSPTRLQALSNAFRNEYMPNGFYIPLQLDEGDGTQLALMKRSLGKNFTADRPLERIYAQAAMTAYSNESNRQKQLVLLAAVQNDVQIAGTQKPLFDVEPVIELKRNPTTGEITEGMINLTMDRDSIGAWVGEKFYRLRVNDPILKNALDPVIKDTAEIQQVVFGAIGYFTRIASLLRTSVNPSFAVFNFLRDQGSAASMLDKRIPYGTYVAAIPGAGYKAFYNVFAQAAGQPVTAEFQEAIDAGAFISQRTYLGVDETLRNVTQDLAPTLGGKIKAGVADPASSKLGVTLTALANALESTTRLAIYDAAKASGLSTREAAYQAKTTTVNFEEKSEFTRVAGPFYMFVNAKVQGTRNYIEKAYGPEANPRTQAALAGVAVLGLIAAAMGYANSERDRDGLSLYVKIPDYKRDAQVIMKEGTVGVPLPQEAALFYVMGNSIGDVVFGNSGMAEGAARFAKNLMQQLAPFGAAQSDPFSKNTDFGNYLARLFVPTVGQPVLDSATNRDTFGRAIVPEGLSYKSKEDYEKYKRKENLTSIAMAKELYDRDIANVSPATITYLGKYLEGGAVSFWADLIDPKAPAYVGQETNPITKRFVASAQPFVNEELYKEASDKLKRIVTRGANEAGGLDFAAYDALYKKFQVFDKYRQNTLFKGYQKMTDEQLSVAGQKKTAGQLELMREYNLLTGVVKP